MENDANVSSWSARQVEGAPPPGWPLKSASALTVTTSSYAAGVDVEASAESLPAATTKVMPLATALQIDLCMASLLVLPQLPSSEPLPPRLMFATSILSALAAT